MTTTYRNPYIQPFDSNSIWNKPIGSSATYGSSGLATSGATEAPVLDYEHIILTPTAPQINVYYSGSGWPTVCSSPTSGTLLQTVPIPSSITFGADGGNNGSAFLGPDYRTIQQNQPFCRCYAGANGTALVAPSSWTVDFYGAGNAGAHGGSALSSIGGSLRVGELRPNQTGPAHAIKLNINSGQFWSGSPGFVWPATVRDSGNTLYSGSNQNIQMGSLMAIPPSVTLASLSLQTNLSGDTTKGPGAQLFWTLQNYGAYLVDSTASTTTPGFGISIEASGTGPTASGYVQGFEAQFFNDWGYGPQQWGAGSAWANDFLKLMAALRPVTNNSSSSIGGGGTPRQPLAAPLSGTFTAGSQNFANASTSFSINVPAHVDGQMLFANIGCSGNAVITAPAGWNIIGSTSSGSTSTDVKQNTYRRVASAEPASYAWTTDIASDLSGFIWNLQDVDPNSPVHVSSVNSGSGTTVTANAVTTSINNTLLVYAAVNHSASTSWGANNFWTQHSGPQSSANIKSVGNTASLYDKISTGNFSTTASGGASGDKWAAQLISFAPNTGSSGGTSASPSITGTSGSGAVGTVGISKGTKASIIGVSATVSTGIVKGNVGPNIAGVSASTSVGFIYGRAVQNGVVGSGQVGTFGLAETSTAPINGVGASTAVGPLISSFAKGITGTSATGAVGSLSSVSSVNGVTLGVDTHTFVGSIFVSSLTTTTLNGVSGTTGIGSVAAARTVTLDGTLGTIGIGNIIAEIPQAVTGVHATASVGTIPSAHNIFGIVGTGSAGSIVGVGSSVSTPAVGVHASMFAGSVTIGIVQNITVGGISASGAAGTLSAISGAERLINGVAGHASAGSIQQSVSSFFTGITGIAEIGGISAEIDYASSVSGVSASVSVGSIGDSNVSYLFGTSGVGYAQQVGTFKLVYFGLNGVAANGEVEQTAQIIPFPVIGVEGESSVGSVSFNTATNPVMGGVAGNSFVESLESNIITFPSPLSGVVGFTQIGGGVFSPNIEVSAPAFMFINDYALFNLKLQDAA